MGNSRGIILPKPLISQLNFGTEVELEVERDAIILRKPPKRARSGWAEAAASRVNASEPRLAWPELSNRADATLRW
ncbi:MAG: AbrB/MazE/SpoVT family DNA-binding domain-containing protein [Candidatus Eremiobacteraeota bacterium]|nr:AbrB/MazE/SpoVT family DNA-binding domain-containing protein [Candidatus Eremiobacteraeota bacterium]